MPSQHDRDQENNHEQKMDCVGVSGRSVTGPRHAKHASHASRQELSQQIRQVQSAQAQEKNSPHDAQLAQSKVGGARADKKRPALIALVVVFVILVGCVAAGAGYLLWMQTSMDKAAEQAADTPDPAIPDDAENNLPENPIDFPALKLENPDIYAWIYIPNTEVNYPIVQHLTDDSFYLTHNVDGELAPEGAIYTEMANATDFSDPVTLIYGHNLVNGTMFSTLHYFENAAFFNENDRIYIYLPHRILTYEIVSAYQYDDRHILNSFDFSDPTVVRSYFDYVVAPESMLVNVREGVVLEDTDKIIQLSTCMSDAMHSNTRYLVTGVLVNEQQTA